MYKYFYNTRGRAIRIDQSKADTFRQKGFVEITKDQFKDRPYDTKYDRGPNYHPPSTTSQSKPNKPTSKRKILKTKRA